MRSLDRLPYTLDGLGRLTKDEVTQFGSSTIDTRINAIGLGYDALGRTQTVTSYTGSSVVANQVKFKYTALWQLDTLWQQHDGAVVDGAPGESLKVRYTYDTKKMSLGNWSRPTSMTYPDGNTSSFEYGATGSPDARISRVTKLDPSKRTRYKHVGLGLVCEVDYVTPDVQLDRWVDHIGRRTSGTYGGWDKFGRVVRHMWVDGDFTTNTSAVPNLPPIVEQAFTYNNASDRLDALDGRPGAKQNIRDRAFEYDALHRLVESKRGASGSSFTHGGRSQSWLFDVLGNWTKVWTDTNAPYGTYSDTDELDDRDHGESSPGESANELDLRVLKGQGAQGADLTLTLTHDKNGNVRTAPIPNGSGGQTAVTYTHDAWDRLVRVEYASQARLEMEYNGLNHCVVRRADTDASGTPDQQSLRYYAPSWQLLEERIDDNWTAESSTVDRRVQYIWGKRYIDDLVFRRQDGNADGDYADAQDTYWYHLSDVQFSTVAVLDRSATLLERVEYNAYGQPRHHWRGDLDGDGDLDSADNAILDTLVALYGTVPITSGNYNADADLDRDGDIDSADQAILNGDGTQAALPLGQLSASGVGNIIGFSGYVYNGEVQLYLVRFRCYDAVLGRWVERDPLGYVDGMNLYEYVAGMPLGGMDPYGLMGLPSFFPIELATPFAHWLFGDSPSAVRVRGGVNIALGLAEVAGGFLVSPAIGLWATIPVVHGATEVAAGLWQIRTGEVQNNVIHDYLGPWVDLGMGLGGGVGIIRGLIKCVAAGTPVSTPDGPVPIEDLNPGDRVLITTPQAPCPDRDEAVWRLVTLIVPDIDGRWLVIRSLQPWLSLQDAGCEPGRWINNAIPEFGVDAPGLVLSIDPCPPIEPGPGTLVIATCTSSTTELIELHIGDGPPLRVTDYHLLYSADRSDWVHARDLRSGEHLTCRDGTRPISAIARTHGETRVYNLQLHDEHHAYYAGAHEVLSHNLLAKIGRLIKALKRPAPGATVAVTRRYTVAMAKMTKGQSAQLRAWFLDAGPKPALQEWQWAVLEKVYRDVIKAGGGHGGQAAVRINMDRLRKMGCLREADPLPPHP